MEPQEKLTTQQFIIDRLHDVQRKVESGNIQDALAELKEVKAADAKNIYIIALEKQILKLTDASITPEFKQEVIKSLPPMIERAINDSQRRLAEKAQEPKEAKEKEAALEKLKSQYLHRADEYVEKGDYEHALEEIRRIYIIDPNNVVAKEYEQKIEQLAKLKAKSEEEKTAPKATPPVEQKEEETPAEKKGGSKVILIAIAAVIVAALGVWLLTSQSPKETPQQSEQQSVTIEKPATGQPAVPEQKTQPQPPTKEQKQAEQKQQQAQQPSQKPETKPEQKPTAEQTKVAVTQPTQQPAPQAPTPQPETKPQQTAQEPAPAPAAEEAPAPKPFVAIESPPQIVKRETPKYPEIAYRMRMEGKVIVEVTVDPQGKPIQAKVARSTSDVFNDAAIEAAMKSTYKPAMMSTGPVTAKVYVPFDFKLR